MGSTTYTRIAPPLSLFPAPFQLADRSRSEAPSLWYVPTSSRRSRARVALWIPPLLRFVFSQPFVSNRSIEIGHDRVRAAWIVLACAVVWFRRLAEMKRRTMRNDDELWFRTWNSSCSISIFSPDLAPRAIGRCPKRLHCPPASISGIACSIPCRVTAGSMLYQSDCCFFFNRCVWNCGVCAYRACLYSWVAWLLSPRGCALFFLRFNAEV